MPRRKLLEGGLLTAMAGGQAAAAPDKPKSRALPEWYELRTIRLRLGAQVKIVNTFLAEVALPALGRLGVGPVGVFETLLGPQIPTLHVLIPYKSPGQLALAYSRLGADPAFTKGAAALAYLEAPAAQPAYVRLESTLLAGFESMPKLEAPEKKPRIFELRTYESPGELGHAKKMDMFLKMGETEIFRRVGLSPVFFAKTVIGPRLPNFVYLLTFPDLAAREKAWAAFRADPEWNKLRATPGYGDADIMSNISDLVLRPTGYSQI